MNVMALLADGGKINFSKLYWTNLIELSDLPITWNWILHPGSEGDKVYRSDLVIMGGQV
jgi:hypothetical protein